MGGVGGEKRHDFGMDDRGTMRLYFLLDARCNSADLGNARPEAYIGIVRC
jgi:hypothetical protein